MKFGVIDLDAARAARSGAQGTATVRAVETTSPATNAQLTEKLYSQDALAAEQARIRARLEAERLAAMNALNKTSSPGRNWVLWGVGGTVLVTALWWALKK